MNIELRHIDKRFGAVHANADINLAFAQGRIVGILGENGAGKSTLMKILSGFQPADSGEILIDGRATESSGPTAAIANGIGMLQQDPLDVGAFTVLENFIYGGSDGIALQRAQAESALRDLSGRFGFALDPHQPIDNLLIAQRQQLEIVRLLALGVRALILDEPTTGISAEQKETLFHALRQLAHEQGMIVLLVSHKLEDVIELCDEVVVLRAGRMVGGMDMPASQQLTSRVIADTKQQLVTLMFGEELDAQCRPHYEIGAPIFVADKLVAHDLRLDMQPISLTAHAGEVIGLAGLGGSGQELFMRACARLGRVTGGSLHFEGRNILGASYRQLFRRGLVFGAAGRLEEGLIAGLTLTEHTALVADDGMQIDWRAAAAQTDARIAQYRVKGRAGDNIEQLSGGNQQRVLIGLLPDHPKLLILEQPTRGLDVGSIEFIHRQLIRMRDAGAGILLVSSELDEVLSLADRVAVMFEGKIIDILPIAEADRDTVGLRMAGVLEAAS